MVPVVCWSVLKTISHTRILEISLTFACPSHDERFVLNAEIVLFEVICKINAHFFMNSLSLKAQCSTL